MTQGGILDKIQEPQNMKGTNDFKKYQRNSKGNEFKKYFCKQRIAEFSGSKVITIKQSRLYYDITIKSEEILYRRV